MKWDLDTFVQTATGMATGALQGQQLGHQQRFQEDVDTFQKLSQQYQQQMQQEEEPYKFLSSNMKYLDPTGQVGALQDISTFYGSRPASPFTPQAFMDLRRTGRMPPMPVRQPSRLPGGSAPVAPQPPSPPVTQTAAAGTAPGETSGGAPQNFWSRMGWQPATPATPATPLTSAAPASSSAAAPGGTGSSTTTQPTTISFAPTGHSYGVNVMDKDAPKLLQSDYRELIARQRRMPRDDPRHATLNTLIAGLNLNPHDAESLSASRSTLDKALQLTGGAGAPSEAGDYRTNAKTLRDMWTALPSADPGNAIGSLLDYYDQAQELEGSAKKAGRQVVLPTGYHAERDNLKFIRDNITSTDPALKQEAEERAADVVGRIREHWTPAQETARLNAVYPLIKNLDPRSKNYQADLGKIYELAPRLKELGLSPGALASGPLRRQWQNMLGKIPSFKGVVGPAQIAFLRELKSMAPFVGVDPATIPDQVKSQMSDTEYARFLVLQNDLARMDKENQQKDERFRMSQEDFKTRQAAAQKKSQNKEQLTLQQRLNERFRQWGLARQRREALEKTLPEGLKASMIDNPAFRDLISADTAEKIHAAQTAEKAAEAAYTTASQFATGQSNQPPAGTRERGAAGGGQKEQIWHVTLPSGKIYHGTKRDFYDSLQRQTKDQAKINAAMRTVFGGR